MGVKDVEFWTFKRTDTRQMLITFNNEESWDASLTKDHLQVMRHMFLMDRARLEILAERDALETVMWFTAQSAAAEEAARQYMALNQVQAQEPEEVIKLIKENKE